MSDNTSAQAEQVNQLPPCDPEVFSNGVSLGLFEMPKEKAESLCEALRLATGYKIDWHYFAGRAHIKALPAEQEDSELSRVKAASIESIFRAYQAEARAEKAEAMVDWLANQAADICADAYPKSEVLRWWEDSNWKEAARRAVAGKGE